MNVGRVLASLPDNQARAEQCLQWAEQERDRYFRGQDDTIADVVLSTSDMYRGLDRAARIETGRMRWKLSGMARSIVEDEAMYSRWAMMFYNASTAETLANRIQANAVFAEAARKTR